jgi:hypothetical protein
MKNNLNKCNITSPVNLPSFFLSSRKLYQKQRLYGIGLSIIGEVMKGYISLWRSLTEHWLWQDKPFTKGQAWIDILFECNHADQKVLIQDKLILCKRGESLKSLETWAKRWGWHKSKVRRFLELLKTDTMIELKSERKTTHLKVLYYNEYQKKRTANETKVNLKRTSNESHLTLNNNDNNDNNDNNIYIEFKEVLFNELKIKTKQEKDVRELLNQFSLDQLKKVIENWKIYNIGSKKRRYCFSCNWTKFYEKIGIFIDRKLVNELIKKESYEKKDNPLIIGIPEYKETPTEKKIFDLKKEIKNKEIERDNFLQEGDTLDNIGSYAVGKYNTIINKINDIKRDIEFLEKKNEEAF